MPKCENAILEHCMSWEMPSRLRALAAKLKVSKAASGPGLRRERSQNLIGPTSPNADTQRAPGSPTHTQTAFPEDPAPRLSRRPATLLATRPQAVFPEGPASASGPTPLRDAPRDAPPSAFPERFADACGHFGSWRLGTSTFKTRTFLCSRVAVGKISY